jgi:purine/pyrimidine-nucleoside phosphorylase
MATISHNSYFDGGVQSLGFETDSRRSTVGVISPGTFRFDTDAPERMTVVCGELAVLMPGESEWQVFGERSVFEIPGNSVFEVRASVPSAYLCEFL